MTDFLKIAKSIVVHFAHICAYGVETVKDTSTPGIGVQLLFDDKFGSVLICIGKPKVSVGGGEWA